MVASDAELKVSEALGRTCRKAPGREGNGPKDLPEHNIKVVLGWFQRRAKAILLSESTRGLMMKLFLGALPPGTLKAEASW
ncbi:hypothetical protein P7K49_036816, partial [Saguinus oedipus]